MVTIRVSVFVKHALFNILILARTNVCNCFYAVRWFFEPYIMIYRPSLRTQVEADPPILRGIWRIARACINLQQHVTSTTQSRSNFLAPDTSFSNTTISSGRVSLFLQYYNIFHVLYLVEMDKKHNSANHNERNVTIW